jgi:hypothetical protein
MTRHLQLYHTSLNLFYFIHHTAFESIAIPCETKRLFANGGQNRIRTRARDSRLATKSQRRSKCWNDIVHCAFKRQYPAELATVRVHIHFIVVAVGYKTDSRPKKSSREPSRRWNQRNAAHSQENQRHYTQLCWLRSHHMPRCEETTG